MLNSRVAENVPNEKQRGVCRICGGSTYPLLDLGLAPPANWLMESRADKPAQFPLLLESCECGNFQLRDCLGADVLYTNYSYATPRSPSLTAHYEQLVEHLKTEGHLGKSTRVLEIGSNVGCFLEFLRPHVRSIVGVDPARNIAEIANADGIPTVVDFFNAEFGRNYLRDHGDVDLIVARHCMAHNQDPYLILDGVAELLSPNGTLVIENAYAITTFQNNEFDQIYHEHMFYFTLHAIKEMLTRSGFILCDVMVSEIHGGSVACVAKRCDSNARVADSISGLLEQERVLLEGGLAERFAASASRIQEDLRSLIADLLAQGKSIYGYGATAKGATLLNSTGVTYREIPYCADSTPIKQGLFVPKCGVEIVSEAWAFKNPPDVFLLTAWNYRDELIAKVRSAGLDDVRFIVPVPAVSIVS